MEKMINRIAIVLLPKEPCVDWLKNQLGEFYTSDICRVFLLDLYEDFVIGHMPGLIKKHYERMFTDMLDAYTNNKSYWPEVSYDTFTKWFDIKSDEVVVDLGETEIIDPKEWL